MKPFELLKVVTSDAKQARERRRNKKRSDIPGTRSLWREPKLTADVAYEFVKLLSSGIPAARAIAYFAPDYYTSIDTAKRRDWLSRWSNDVVVATAAAKFNSGQWQELEKDARLQIALDKHLAELAYYLYTTTFAEAEGGELRKLTDAREAIMAVIKSQEGDAETPWMRAMREMLSDKLGATMGPPQLQADIEAVEVAVGESIAIEHIAKHKTKES